MAEVCNGLDDDCDGTADDGNPGGDVACGTDEGECVAGLTQCVGGIIRCIGETGPAAELCNGLDDDCDGTADDGNPEGGMTCGTDVGECTAGVITCMGGTLVCFGEIPSSAEVCDGWDNDCDGTTDDGNPGGGAACGPTALDGIGICQAGMETCVTTGPGAASIECIGAVFPGVELCNGLDDDCDGTDDNGDPGGGGSCGTDVGECAFGTEHCVDGAITCTGQVGPGTELCDGLDNDCDGTADDGDPGGGAACGMDVGVCISGNVHCIGGALVCDGGVLPTTELCNGLDDDCDGLLDDGNPEGGGLCGPVALDGIGICEAGVTTCVTAGPGVATLNCLGAVYPEPAELCNGLDDDCNGLTDDGIAGGESCGTDEGVCAMGHLECVAGAWVCVGEVGPGTELCDGLDNDCDGETDEGNPEGGEACGTDVGECEPGVTYCDLTLVPPDIVCLGEVGPEEEVCDGLDNDCNHLVDDGLPLGEPCGTDVGICETGNWICLDGDIVCHGGIGPADEVCNGLDDDCDGLVDVSAECPGESVCIEGYCAPPCNPDDEWPCPTGKVCEYVEEYDDTYCVDDLCEDVTCDPGYLCRGGECLSQCEFITCPEGWECIIVDGAPGCFPADCYTPGHECDEGERCREGECEPDPCLDVVCTGTDFCREGACHESCGPDDVCPDGERCFDGACVEDPCFGVECSYGLVCDPDTGTCADDPCAGVDCRDPLVCVDGDCVDDPCSYIACPEDHTCEQGTCIDDSLIPEPEPDAPADAGTDTDGAQNIAATGTGGCVGCTMGSTGSSPSVVAILLAAGALGLALARRRRFGPGLLALAAAMALGSFGCNTTPYCLGDCDLSDAAIDTSESDVTSDSPADGPQDTLADTLEDTLVPDGCTPGAEEICNGVDDDCDDLVDEDFDLENDPGNCGECGNECHLPHAYVSCIEGECVLDPARGCDINYYDCIPDDAADPESMGCELYCIRTRDDDAYCDLYDNDCDCQVDEDIDLTTDIDNCGACGVLCRFFNADPACESGTGLPEDAVCVIDACHEGFHDEDGDPDTGCEYECNECAHTEGACVPGLTCCTDGGGETCNGLDDDCDGDIDEDDPGGGVACGTDEGECVAGILHCVEGGLVCDGEVVPAPETCNGLDDDCDAAADEPDPGWTTLPDEGQPCGSSMGDCERGLTVCVTGALDCQGDTEPSPEICDGHDNDCNGYIDDGSIVGLGDPCGTDEGECETGTMSCVGGVPVCAGSEEPVPETCNGLDDDCDTAIDEDVPGAGATCGSTAGECEPGVLACVGGTMICQGEIPPVAETCNGLDDDCDTAADEGDPGGGAACGETAGECSAGTMHCVSGILQCQGATGPGTETCNGLDDDCDGTADDGTLPGIGVGCGTDVGECTAGTVQCIHGVAVCVGSVGPETETCNGLDDDCDGAVDGGDPGGGVACGTDTGTCIAGTMHCIAGVLQCQGEVTPTVEICDTLDNDCDGTADDGNPGGGGICGTDTGACTAGTLNCVAGLLVCEGEVGPSPEICNGLDDDCDAAADEANPGGGVRCGTNVGECEYGTTVCTGGVLECPDDIESVAETCNGLDDDCDAVADNNLTPPVGFCLSTGVCAGTAPACVAASWTCPYPVSFQAVETWCDALNNDCDTTTDEGCPTFPATDVWLDQNASNTIAHDLVTDGGLAVHVAYMDRRNGEADIYYRRSTTGGSTWTGADVRLDSGTAGVHASVYPALVAGWGDNVAAVWADFRDDADARNIYKRYSTSDGGTWSATDTRIDTGLDRDCFGVSAAMDATGGVYVAYEYVEANRSRRIYVSRSVDGGATFSAPVRVDHNAGPNPQIASDAHVAVDQTGRVYVAWRDNRNGSGDIYFNRSLDFGATWSGTDTRLDSGAGYSDRPRIAATSTGSVYVVFEDDRFGSVDVFAASSQSFGAAFGADVKLDIDAFANDSLNPEIAALPGSSRAWVVWEDYRDGLADVRMNMTSDGGVTWGASDKRVDADPAGMGGSTHPDVAADGGLVFVVWEDDRNGALDVYLNFSMDWGATFQPVDWRVDTGTAGSYDSQLPEVEASPGRCHIVWMDYRNGTHFDGDIYYRLFM